SSGERCSSPTRTRSATSSRNSSWRSRTRRSPCWGWWRAGRAGSSCGSPIADTAFPNACGRSRSSWSACCSSCTGKGRTALGWTLDPHTAFLNHGSFGACPAEVLDAQRAWRERLERQPVQFLSRDLEGLLDETRAALGAFLGADPDDLAFVANATSGVNTVLRSLTLGRDDEVLVTDHAYGACRNAAEFVTRRAGARLVSVHIPFPLQSVEQIVGPVLAAVTRRTRLALLDHVTSPTGLVFPIARLVAALQIRGVDVLVDGAHAPGMLPLDLRRLNAAYYTGNAHKWLCAPKGAAFLWVRRDRQALVHPLPISHGFSDSRLDRSRFRLEFDWMGTIDPTAILCIPAALQFMEGRHPGGWPAVMSRNHALAVTARRGLCEAL